MILGPLAWLGWQPPEITPLTSLGWAEVSFWQLPTAPGPESPQALQQYLSDLARRGYAAREQGVWIGSDWDVYANHQGELPLSAASLTKIATTLAALEQWGPDRRYVTRLEATGRIANGVLQGDLILRGQGDPLLVWEDAIAMGQALEQLGIFRVSGDLVVVGTFHMNFDDEDEANPSADFAQAIDSRQWSPEIQEQFEAMATTEPAPEIALGGQIRQEASFPEQQLLLAYDSLTLGQILQQMNAYSNNVIAERLAAELGGSAEIVRVAQTATGFPATEIQLQNGSGLGLDNRISARAAAALMPAIARTLADTSWTLADLFPVGDINQFGTVEERTLPAGVAVKTGSLWRASALAGAIPTRDRGWIYFAIINQGTPIVPLREEQDRLLAALTQDWALEPVIPTLPPIQFGDPTRLHLAN